MKAGPNHDPSPEYRSEENDPLWDLLAQSPRPEPDAWFAARTMARCRHEGLSAERLMPVRGVFSKIWRWLVGGGLVASFAAVLLISQTFQAVQTDTAEKQKNVQEAFEVMATIDNNDSDSSSSSTSTSTSWQDTSL